MSLRLPSQNKFKPTARPGVRKPNVPARSTTTPSQPSSSVIGGGQKVPVRSGSQQPPPSQNSSQKTLVDASGSSPAKVVNWVPDFSPAPSSSQTIPLSSQLGPSSSQTIPSSSQTAATSPAHAHAPSSQPAPSPSPQRSSSQLPPTLGANQSETTRPILPKPISSAHIQAIRKSSPTKASSQLPPSSNTSPIRQPPSTPAPVSTPLGPPALTPASTSNPAPLSSSRAPSVPPQSTGRESTPRSGGLSLLNAARAHAAAGPSKPSPGGLKRGSSRAPSVTPQPGRAPSVTPQPRESSVTPFPRARTPSATPQPQSTFGFPPTLASYSQQSGLPPSLGTSAPARSRSATPVQPSDPAALAALVVAGIQPISRPPAYALGKSTRRVRRRAPVKRKAPVEGDEEEDGEVEETEDGEGRPKKVARKAGVRKNKRNGSEVPSDERETSDDAESVATTANGTRRTKESSRRKLQPIRIRPITVSQISLHDVQPDEMIGERVDETMTTMGDLATILAAQGKVSQRAIKIDEFRRNEELKKREAAQVRSVQLWKRNQIKRRKVRSTKNADRARRRIELEQLGMGSDEVSADEDNSEEEYEPEPERLTPESTPDPDAIPGSQMPAGSDEENEERSDNGEDGWENGKGDENGDENPLFMPGGEDEEGQADFLASLGLDGDAGGIVEDEDPDIAAFRAAGFDIDTTARPADAEAGVDGGGIDKGEGEGGEDGEDEDYDEYDWDNGEVDIGAYRDSLEQRRRRFMYERDDLPVEDIDDETKFVNSASFAKNLRPQRWTPMETELFYQVIEETGENYTLMKAYFPGRTIKQLKMKGLRENRSNLAKMTAAILSRKPLDKEYLTKSAGYDASKPWDREEALFEEARQDAQNLRRAGDGDGDDEDGERLGTGMGMGVDGDGDVDLDLGMDLDLGVIDEEEKGSDYEGEKDDEYNNEGDVREYEGV